MSVTTRYCVVHMNELRAQAQDRIDAGVIHVHDSKDAALWSSPAMHSPPKRKISL